MSVQLRTLSAFAVTLLATMLIASPAKAVITYLDDFDVNTSAAWNVNASTGNNAATFAFDYSSVGIPSAPNSTGGTTRGLKLEANYNTPTTPTGQLFTGLSASPIGQSFTGDYVVKADVWLNYLGPPPAGGSGTTQAAGMGVMTNGTSSQWAGTTPNSIHFSTTIDGGSNTDYRAYSPASNAVAAGQIYLAPTGVYAAGNLAADLNASDAYYTTNFPGVAPPAAQQALFPATQTNVAAQNGTTAFAWHAWTLTKAGSTVTWAIDGITLATINVADASAAGNTPGTNFLLNYYDTNNTASTSAASRSLTFGLFDNVRVEAVPEVGSVLFGGVATILGGAGAWLSRRRQA